MRRMKRRRNGKKKVHHKKRRHNAGHKASHRRRRRRNEGAPAAPKARKPRRSAAELEAGLEAKLAKVRARAAKEVEKAQQKTAKAEQKAARASAKAQSEGAKRSRKAKSALRRKAKQLRAKRKAGTDLSPMEAAFLARQTAPRKPRKKKQHTQNWHKAHSLSKRGTKGEKAVVRAWRSAKRAQKLAVSPKEQRLLRAMGLAGVPNPGMMGGLKDIGALMPQIGASAAALAGVAFAGQKLGKMIEDRVESESAKRFVVPAVSVGLALGGYMIARRSKALAKFSMPILLGGMAAAVVHSIVRIKVGEKTIAQQLGLPLGEYAAMAGYGEYAAMAGYGEYAAMAGYGEYAAMAGGTAYSGERGIFSGLDDTDPVLNGTDDEDEVDMEETLSDEGVNADEGSLNGSIFD